MQLKNGFILMDEKGVAGIFFRPQDAMAHMLEGDLALPAMLLVDAEGQVIDYSDESPALLN